MSRIPAALPLVVALLALGVLAAQGSGAAIAYFQSPSKNIGCAYIPVITRGDVPTLRCEITSGLVPLPPRPRGCGDAVWGRAVLMTRTGPARRICISDTIREPSARVLRYGTTWRAGGFTCVSRVSEVRCENRAGHGWRLSRQRSTLF